MKQITHAIGAIAGAALLAGCDVAVPDDTNPDLATPPPRAVALAQSDSGSETGSDPLGSAPVNAPVATGPVDTSSAIGFALTTTHGVGEKQYRRLPILGAVRMARACADYASDDAAQTAFLLAGGPDKDPSGMDPDGDGFACGWSPVPYRQALAE